MKINLTNRIKQLPKGNLRLLIVLSIILPVIITIIGSIKKIIDSDMIPIFLFCMFFIYWIIVRVVIWISDGYKE